MKSFLLAALLLAMASRAEASPLKWPALGAVAGDLGSTAYVLHRCEGCREANPLGVPLVAALDGALWITTARLEKDHPKLAKWLWVGMIGVRGWATVHNLRTGR